MGGGTPPPVDDDTPPSTGGAAGGSRGAWPAGSAGNWPPAMGRKKEGVAVPVPAGGAPPFIMIVWALPAAAAADGSAK